MEKSRSRYAWPSPILICRYIIRVCTWEAAGLSRKLRTLSGALPSAALRNSSRRDETAAVTISNRGSAASFVFSHLDTTPSGAFRCPKQLSLHSSPTSWWYFLYYRRYMKLGVWLTTDISINFKIGVTKSRQTSLHNPKTNPTRGNSNCLRIVSVLLPPILNSEIFLSPQSGLAM